MTILLELKKMLSSILSSDKPDLRKKGMEDAMGLMAQLDMDGGRIAEIMRMNNIEKENKIIEKILKEVDELEYASDKEIKDIDKEHIDSSEE